VYFGGKAFFNAELYNTKKKLHKKIRNQLHFCCLGIKAKESERYTISFSFAVSAFPSIKKNIREDLSVCFVLVLSIKKLKGLNMKFLVRIVKEVNN
jgi:hypothetical protein